MYGDYIMATVTRGATVGSGGEVTNTFLNSLVNDGSVTNIDRTDLDTSEASLIHKSGAEPPSPVDNEFWHDRQTDLLKRYDSSDTEFRGMAGGAAFTIASSNGVDAGSPVQATSSAAGEIDLLSSGTDRIVGVALETGALSARICVASRGIVTVNKLTGTTVTRGEHVQVAGISGSSTGHAQTTATKTAQTFGICLETVGSGPTTFKALLYL